MLLLLPLLLLRLLLVLLLFILSPMPPKNNQSTLSFAAFRFLALMLGMLTSRALYMLLAVCFSSIFPGRYTGDDPSPQPIVDLCCRMLNATAGRFLRHAFSADAGTCITSGSNNDDKKKKNTKKMKKKNMKKTERKQKNKKKEKEKDKENERNK